MDDKPNNPEQDTPSGSDDPFSTRLDMPTASEVTTEEQSASASKPTEAQTPPAAKSSPPKTAPAEDGTPIMSYIPGTISLGLVDGKEVKQVEISVRNSGQGVLEGQVVPAVDWLTVSGDSAIKCNALEVKKYTIQLKANAPRQSVSNVPLINLTGNAGNLPPKGVLEISGSYTPLPQPLEGIVLSPEDSNFPVAMMEKLDQSVKLALTITNYTKETAKVAIQVNKPWLKLNTAVVTLEPGQGVPLVVSATPAEVSELQQGETSAKATVRMVVEGKPKLTVQREFNLRVQQTGISQSSRLMQWAMYLGVWLAGAFGLAAGMRIVTAVMISRDVSFFSLLLGVIGFGAPFAIYSAFTRVPTLKNAQTQIDQIEDYYSGGTLASSINVPSVTDKWWHIALVVLFVVTGVFGGWLAGGPASRDAGIWLGLFGGLLVGVLGGISGKVGSLSASGEREFEMEQLYRPLAVGIGLTMWAAALKLVGSNSWDILLYILLLLIGMIGIAGSSIKALSLRLHQWSGRLQIALLSGLAAVSMMSLFNMFLNSYSSRDSTFRFAYSPAGFIGTASDRNIILASLFGIVLVIVGVLGATIVMSAFGHNVVKDRQFRLRFSSMLVAGLTLIMFPMLFIWIILSILPLGQTFEGWLIWGIPAAMLTGLLIAIQTRPELVDNGMVMLQQNVSKMTFLPPFMRSPLDKFGTLRAEQIQPVVTWELGLIVVVVGSIVAAPLVLSFWFWIIALGGFLFWANAELTKTKNTV